MASDVSRIDTVMRLSSSPTRSKPEIVHLAVVNWRNDTKQPMKLIGYANAADKTTKCVYDVQTLIEASYSTEQAN